MADSGMAADGKSVLLKNALALAVDGTLLVASEGKDGGVGVAMVARADTLGVVELVVEPGASVVKRSVAGTWWILEMADGWVITLGMVVEALFAMAVALCAMVALFAMVVALFAMVVGKFA